MASANSDPIPITSAKILIAGGFGVGKTTMVATISEITPLTTEAALTTAGERVDDTTGLPAKTSTTVAMDFGRITIAEDLILYLFGTPGQSRFWFMWDELAHGAIGAILLVDPTRISDSFAPVDYFENRDLPYLIAVNTFDGTPRYPSHDLAESLSIDEDVPQIACDPRDRTSARTALITLVQHAVTRHQRTAPPSPSPTNRPTLAEDIE